VKFFLREKEAGIEIKGPSHLDELMMEAATQANDENRLGIIYLVADNQTQLGVVVGGDETVLYFSYEHENPPYYTSKGKQDDDEPVMTCYLLFQHHTEFSRKHVIPFPKGLLAVHEFYKSGTLPASIEWSEV